MKKYVVMTNYGLEGWKITDETDDFRESIRMREKSMGNGNPEVIIFRPVVLTVSEVEEPSPRFPLPRWRMNTPVIEVMKLEDELERGFTLIKIQVDALSQQNADLRAERDKLVGTLFWVRQIVHQAHHEGPVESCPKNTCSGITDALRRAERDAK